MEIDKDKRIKELEESLEEEKMVKKSEASINRDLKEQIEKKDLHIKTILEINENFSNKIAKLRNMLKKLIDEQ